VLTYPAYGEQNTANMVEALYLLATNFNYVDLAREPNFAEGGVETYLLSIFPGFLAVLMKLTPSAQSFFIVTHTIIFALSAGSIALFHAICQKTFTPKIALFSSLLLLMLPIYSTMTELINMEVMLLFFALLSIYYLSERRMILSGICAVFSSLVKGTGGIVCGLYFAACGLVFLFDSKKRFQWNILTGGTIVFALGYLQKHFRYLVFPEQSIITKFAFLIGAEGVLECRRIVLSSVCVGVFCLGLMIYKIAIKKMPLKAQR